jgi:hypothetical protein
MEVHGVQLLMAFKQLQTGEISAETLSSPLSPTMTPWIIVLETLSF